MFRNRVVLGLVVCLVVTLLVSVPLVQGAAGGGRGNRGGQAGARAGQPGARGGQTGGPGGMRFDPERMRQMMEQRLKEQLGATDAEWKVLGPRVMKVSELNRQTSGFGRGGMFFGGRRGSTRGGRPGGQDTPQRELTPVEKASEGLRTALDSDSTSAEAIKKQLKAYRTAKEQAKQKLAVAQKELRQVLTVRQEAMLVLMGMLE